MWCIFIHLAGSNIDPKTKKMNREIASVEGDRILSFTGFYGRLTASNIRAFSHIEFNNLVKDNGFVHSEVTLDHDNYNLSGFENWKFEYGSKLSGNFVNDFAGNTLNLVGFSEITTPQTLITDIDNSDGKDVFANFDSPGVYDEEKGEWTTAPIKMTNDTDTVDISATFSNNAWSWSAGGSAYTLSLENSGTSTSMVLTRTQLV